MQSLQLTSYDNFKTISGYASVFNTTDEHNDMIIPGAFRQSLKDRPTIVLLWQHLVDKPIGVIEQINEDNYGLYVQAKILNDVKCGQEAISLIQSKAIYGLSIGFNPLSYYLSDAGIRIIEEVELWEVSLVTFPANRFAGIIGLKSQEQLPSRIIKTFDKALAALS